MLASIVKVLDPNQGSKSFSQMDFNCPQTPKFEPEQTDDEKFITSEIYRSRLKRRSELIEEIRCAYLRDVVLLKHFLEQHLLHDERNVLIDQWKKAIPSLDLRQQLMLYSPPECSLNVLPCEVCGGQVEIVHHDSSEIEKLAQALDHLDKNEEELRLMIGTQAAKIELYENRLANSDRVHGDEKRVLYGEMRNLKQEIAELQSKNERLTKMNAQLRHENGDFKLAAMEQERLATSLEIANVEVARMKSELRVAEESTAQMRESTALMKRDLTKAEKQVVELTNQLHAEANDKESMKDELVLTKTNLDNALKRNAKLQTLLANARKEVADLEAIKNSLTMDIENLQLQSSTEIESMEKLIDAMREEMSVTEGVLRDVKDESAKLRMANEQALSETKSITEELHHVRTELTNEIEDLKARLDELRSVHVADDASVEAVKKQVRKMSRDKTRKGTPMSGRRQGTLVFGTSREGTPDDNPEPLETPESVSDKDRPPKSARHASTKSRRASKQGIVGAKRRLSVSDTSPRHAEELHSPHAVAASFESVEQKADEILFYNDAEAVVVDTETPPPTAPYEAKDTNISIDDAVNDVVEPPKSTNKSTNGAQVDYKAQLKQAATRKPRGMKGTNGKDAATSRRSPPSPAIPKTPESSTNPTAPQSPAKLKTPESSTHSTALPSPAKPKTPASSPAKPKTPAEKLIDDEAKSVVSEKISEEPKRRTSLTSASLLGSLSCESQVDESTSIILEPVASVTTARKPSLSEAADRSPPKSPAKISSAPVAKLESDGSTQDLSEANMATHSPSKPPQSTIQTLGCQRDDSISVAESGIGYSPSVDSVDEDDLFQEEVTEEVATSWGVFNREIKTLMLENMTLKESTRATEVIAPITIQYSSAIVKSIMNMWQVLITSQHTTNFLIRLKNLVESLQSCVAPEATADDINWSLTEVDQSLAADNIKQYSHWFADYDVDEELMECLLREDLDPETGLMVPFRSFDYFGHDTAELNDRIDVVQQSIVGIKTYNRDLADRVCQLLKTILSDWANGKLAALGTSPAIAGGEDVHEAVFELQNEISLLKHNRLEAEKTRDKLQSELELSRAHVEELLPLVSRVKELTDRTHFLSNALRESNEALHSLEAAHKVSTELSERLGNELAEISNKYTVAQGIVDLNQLVVDEITAHLKDERSTVSTLREELAEIKEVNRRRLDDLNTVCVQTEPLVENMATQTDFLCPPLSLRHHVTEQYNNTKRVYFPIVTPASAPSSDYPPRSASSSRLGTMKHTVQDSFLIDIERGGLGTAESSRYGSASSSYKSKPGSRQSGKASLEVGIPSVFAEAPGTPSNRSSPMAFKNEPIWATSRPGSRQDRGRR